MFWFTLRINCLKKSKHCLTDTKFVHKSLSSLIFFKKLFDLLCFVLEATEEFSSRTLSRNRALPFFVSFCVLISSPRALHVFSAGSRGGRFLLLARVWEDDSTPRRPSRPAADSAGSMFVRTSTHATAQICPGPAAGGAGLPPPPLWGWWQCAPVHVQAAVPARWHE